MNEETTCLTTSPIEPQKLYIIARADLAPGLQAAQACHALRLFAEEHPEEEQKWYEESNNIVLLQVPNEKELLALKEKANGYPVSLFREPDVNDEATAIALGPEARPLTSNLPLLLKDANPRCNIRERKPRSQGIRKWLKGLINS